MSSLVLDNALESNDKTKKFRINSQTLFVTYPKCNLEPSFILEELKKVLDIDSYLIAQEKHMDGSLHLHCYLRLVKKINLKDERKLDINNFHPNIQSCRSPKAVLKYVSKDNNYVTNISDTAIQQAKIENEKVGDVYKRAREATISGTVDDGLKVLEHQKTYRDLCLHGEAIERNLRKLKKSKLSSPFSLDSFNIPTYFEWDKKKTLIIHGPTETGKTSWAKALLPNSLFIRHLDRLKEYSSGEYEGIIMDDMSFSHLHREAQLALVDVYDTTDIHIRYGVATLPAGTPRIITTNMAPDIILKTNDSAIARRVQDIYIPDKLWL